MLRNPFNYYDPIDKAITRWMAKNGIFLLRISIGLIFVWFGVLKFFPGVSPAEQLAGSSIEILSFGIVSAGIGLPILAAWECLIGILMGSITGILFTLKDTGNGRQVFFAQSGFCTIQKSC